MVDSQWMKNCTEESTEFFHLLNDKLFLAFLVLSLVNQEFISFSTLTKTPARLRAAIFSHFHIRVLFQDSQTSRMIHFDTRKSSVHGKRCRQRRATRIPKVFGLIFPIWIPPRCKGNFSWPLSVFWHCKCSNCVICSCKRHKWSVQAFSVFPLPNERLASPLMCSRISNFSM